MDWDWGWISASLLAPVLIPVLALTTCKLLPLEAKYAKKTHWMSQFRDGQLGWVAVAWAAGIFYDVLNVSVPLTLYLKAYLLCAVLSGFAGMFISAGGAIESDPAAPPRKLFLILSIIVAVATAFFAYSAHTEAEKLSHAATAQSGGNT